MKWLDIYMEASMHARMRERCRMAVASRADNAGRGYSFRQHSARRREANAQWARHSMRRDASDKIDEGVE